MLPKLLPRHSSLRSTVFYLFGPGRSNEHTDPHIVAAWDPLLTNPTEARPDHTLQAELVTRLDAPRRLRGITLKAGHVLHIPLSVHRDDGQRGDAEWSDHAHGLITALGVQRCRWIAVHHGLSAKGNDHIHLVVQLVDEDGRAARLSHSKLKTRIWAQAVEERLDLVRTGRPGTGARPLTRGEYERAERSSTEPQRRTLERTVRAAAANTTSPTHFVENLTREGIKVQARTTPDNTVFGGQRVVGYSVSLPPDQLPADDRAIGFGGSQLASDLSLPELMSSWQRPDHGSRPNQYDQTPYAWIPPESYRNNNGWAVTALTLTRHTPSMLTDLTPHEPTRWHAALTSVAAFATVLHQKLGHADYTWLRQPLREATDHLSAAARLARPPGQNHRTHTRDTLPALSRAIGALARTTTTPELAIAIAIILLLTTLVVYLAQRSTHQPRGQSGHHLHTSALTLTSIRHHGQLLHELIGRRPKPDRPQPLATQAQRTTDTRARNLPRHNPRQPRTHRSQ